jgi:hypothetical protein
LNPSPEDSAHLLVHLLVHPNLAHQHFLKHF